MGAERRANPRFVCDLDVRIEVMDEDRSIESRAVDLSFSGICVQAAESVTPGTLVQFHLRLVLPGAESDSLALRGTVVWSTPTKGYTQIGARFQRDMGEDQLRKLDVVLRALAGELDLRPG